MKCKLPLPRLFPDKLIALLVILFMNFSAGAQEKNNETLHVSRSKDTVIENKARLSGGARYFFMSTQNSGSLTDFSAHAAGLRLHYESKKIYGFSLGAGASFAGRIHSSNHDHADPATGQKSRYEIGLFDITDRSKKTMARLDEVYIRYQLPHGFIRAGRQFLNTPFINTQDGRMNMTATEGLWTELRYNKTKLEAGLLTGISPRSTNAWYSIGHSIGLYPQGYNPDGSRADQANNLSSKGILLTGFTQQLKPDVKITHWNQFVENIFNTSLLQIDAEKKWKNNKITGAFQYIRQQKINEGGNTDYAKNYFHYASSNVLSISTGWQTLHWESSLNYTHIFGARYLMPREWGKDPFFTFMPRERNEGFADVNAYVIRTSFSPVQQLKFQASFGYFDLPPVNECSRNKYGMPSYTQLNLELRYAFSQSSGGPDLTILYVRKDRQGEIFQNQGYVINKVNMSLYNIVFNYKF